MKISVILKISTKTLITVFLYCLACSLMLMLLCFFTTNLAAIFCTSFFLSFIMFSLVVGGTWSGEFWDTYIIAQKDNKKKQKQIRYAHFCYWMIGYAALIFCILNLNIKKWYVTPLLFYVYLLVFCWVTKVLNIIITYHYFKKEKNQVDLICQECGCILMYSREAQVGYSDVHADGGYGYRTNIFKTEYVCPACNKTYLQ